MHTWKEPSGAEAGFLCFYAVVFPPTPHESKFGLAFPGTSLPSVPFHRALEETIPHSFHPNAGPDKDSDAHLGPCWVDEIKATRDVREDGTEGTPEGVMQE